MFDLSLALFEAWVGNSFDRVRENWAFSRFGGDLLSRGLSPSTIGAAVLNFRVRDGTGCFTCAMTTKPRKSPRSTFLLCKKATMRQAASLSQIKARCRTVLIINQQCRLVRHGYPTQGRCMFLVLFDRLPLRYLRRWVIFPLLDQIKPIGRLVPVN